MKKLFLLFSLIAILDNTSAEIIIKIKVYRNNTASINLVDNTGAVLDSANIANLDDKKIAEIENDSLIKIDISYEHNYDGGLVIFQSYKGAPTTYTFTFGRGGTKYEPSGAYVISFKKSEKLEWAFNQTFSFPCQILIKDKDTRTIQKAIFDLKENKTQEMITAGFTGIAYYDALTLANCETVNTNLVLEILNFYNGRTKIRDTNIFYEYKNNTFIYGYIENDKKCYKGTLQKGISGFGFKGMASQVGGLDVSNIANGMAEFMIERAKQELTITFFDRFKNFVDENQEVQILFPKTTEMLKRLLSYKYPEILPALRTSFYDDLTSLTTNMNRVLELPRYEALLKNFPEIRIAVRSLGLIEELKTGQVHPSEILEQFAEFPEWKDKNSSDGIKNIGSSLQLASMISQSLRSNAESLYAWVSTSDFRKLMKDKKAFDIYLGLLYQQVYKSNIILYLKNKPPLPFSQIMLNQKDFLSLFQKELNRFLLISGQVRAAYEDIIYKQNNHTKITNEDYYNYINTSIDLIEYCFEIANIFYPESILTDYTSLARKANDLFKYCYQEQYAQAIMTTTDIYLKVHELIANRKEIIKDTGIAALRRFGSPPDELKESIAYLIQNKPGKLTQDQLSKVSQAVNNSALDTNDISKIQLLLAMNSEDRFFSIIAKITKYGLFMANMTSAKSPEEVKSVIESAALPVGSSSIKKYSRFNIAVQSYLSVYYKLNEGNTIPTSWSDKFGFSGPIGVSFSKGFKKGGSLSLMCSVFDLGAIIDYQITQDSVPVSGGAQTAVVNKDYKVELGQIISPGVFLVYGAAWNIPISLGLGAQYGPGLGKITSTGTTVVNNPEWRFLLFLGVDIPLFNMFTVSKKNEVQ